MVGNAPKTIETSPSVPSLAPRPVTGPARCRCGTKLAPPQESLVLEGLAEEVESFFRDKSFCCEACVRAEFLELFERLDSLLDSPAESMVADLRPTYSLLARTFADLAHE